MNFKKSTYKLRRSISCLFMMASLLWLTASAPYILEVKMGINKQYAQSAAHKQSAETNNPYAGLNEEHCNSAVGFSEYLHESLSFTPFASQQLIHSGSMDGTIFIEYYGELLSPPPEA